MTDELNTETESTEAPSLRDSLLATFDEMEGVNTESDAPETTIKAEPASEGSEVAADETATDEVTEAETPIQAPHQWSEEDRKLFEGLDDNGKKILLGIHKNQESGLTEKMEQLATQRKRYEGFDQFFSAQASLYPNVKREDFERAVINLAPQLLTTYKRMQEDPVGTLRQLADAYNVNDKLSEALLGQDNDEGARSKRQEDTKLKEENDRLKSERQERLAAEIDARIASFRDAKDDGGNLKHKYFSELEPTMTKLLSADPTLTLDEAYTKALRLDKHEELLKAEVEKAAKAAEETRRAKVKDIRKPGRPSVGRSAGTVTPDSKPKSTRDTLSEEWDRLEASN